MIRLSNSRGCQYELKDTVSKAILGGCKVHTSYNKLEIWCVNINEEFRRKGYATLMLQRIIRKFRKDERPLLLYVLKDNSIAIHLYKKLGFEIIGEFGFSGYAWSMQYKGGR